MFPSGCKQESNSESETKQGGLTMSWGVSPPSSRSRRGWSSQIPQMCHSLLSPQKPPDDLEKQRHVNNIACVKHWRWYHRSSQTLPHPHPSPPTSMQHWRFGCILKRWKEKLHLLWYGSDAWTVLLLWGGRYGGNASKTDGCAYSHPSQAGLIGSFLEGAGDRSGSERGRSPGARWQM